MTSTTDTSEHPEVSEISDLTEGLLPPARTAEIRQHLIGCPLCADVHASLEEIRGLLGTLPGPPRMPEDIAGRIDAALAAEALLDTLAPEAETPATGTLSEGTPAAVPVDDEGTADEEAVHATVQDPERGRETASVSRETSSGSTVAGRPADRPAGHARGTGSSGPGRKARRMRRRTTAAIGSVLTVAALGVGTLLLQSRDDGTSPTAHKSPSASSEAPGTFAVDTLGNKVSDLLGKKTKEPSFGTQDSGPKTPRTDSPMPKLAEDDLPPCVQQGTRRTEAPLASEKGTYRGQDAYLVVLPDRNAPERRVTAYVVDASCAGKSSATPGTLLYTHSYDRG
ncbi:hypothetical protein GTW43_31365 [Streptomyces sp. SID5785]|uniref:hypothetical protein n=1 Tax=Streptomyces sp. SID5785 TaxID=2690309 RepID=UPI001360C6A7|nr:hypothetical protein [Streptomyces sp. SID5785]